MLGDLARHPRGVLARPRDGVAGQVLVGEIERRLGEGERAHQPFAPAFAERAERAVELAQRLARLRGGLRRHQVGQPFGRRQVHLAVDERAAREFARLRQPQPRQPAERAERAVDDRAAAVAMDFRHVLAGETGRRGEPEDQRAIERRPVARVGQGGDGGAAGRRQAPGQRFERGAGAGARQAQDGDSRRSGARRQREDRVAGAQSPGGSINRSTGRPSTRCSRMTASMSSRVSQRYHTPSG